MTTSTSKVNVGDKIRPLSLARSSDGGGGTYYCSSLKVVVYSTSKTTTTAGEEEEEEGLFDSHAQTNRGIRRRRWRECHLPTMMTQ